MGRVVRLRLAACAAALLALVMPGALVLAPLPGPRFPATAAAAATTAAGVAAATVAAAAAPPTGGTAVLGQDFHSSSVPDPNWAVSGQTCLTGAAPGSAAPSPSSGSAAIPGCAATGVGPAPVAGAAPGYLQLTDARVNATAAAVYQRPIPAPAGLSVTFAQYQYSQPAPDVDPGDGLAFFLVDGSTGASSVGGYGGSLGYAQSGANPGVAGGYLGLGFDVYGNFLRDVENRGQGCPAGQRSGSSDSDRLERNVVTLRGSGSGTTGYCYLASTTTGPPGQPTSTLTDTLRVTTANPEVARRWVNVQVTPAPNPRVVVLIRYGDADSWHQILDVPAPDNPPSSYKFGFTASSGGATDVHLISDVTASTINRLGDLRLVKQVSRAGTPLPATLTAGTAVPYEFMVSNGSLGTISNLVVTDSGSTTAITCDATTVPALPDPGGTTICRGTHTVTAADVSAGAITSTATASADLAGLPLTPVTSTLTVPVRAALSVTTQPATAGPYQIGQTVDYTYTLTNTGGAALDHLTVTDNRVTTGSISCAAATLAPGASTTCTGSTTLADSTITAAGTITNTATAAAVTPIGQSVSATGTASIPIRADLGLTLVASPTSPAVGDRITLTVTLRNAGPSAARNVTVSDQVANGLAYVSSVAGVGTTYTAATGAWTVPLLASGDSRTLTLAADVVSAGAVTNGATITGTDQPDANQADNSASVTLNASTPATDLAVTAFDSDFAPRAGRPTRIAVTAHNVGQRAATAVAVAVPLPSLLTLDSATPSTGAYDASSGRWTIGALAVGATATLDLVVRPSASGTVSVTAALVSAIPADANPLNDVDTAQLTVRPAQADLSITKTVSPAGVSVGDVVTYVVRVSNAGPDPAPAVVVRERLGALGADVLVGYSVSQGTVDVGSARWDVGGLAAGAAPATLTLRVRVGAARTVGNVAAAEDPGTVDPDPADNTAYASFSASPTPVDLAVHATIGRSTLVVGERTTVTLTATNRGPNVATAVVVHSSVPAGVAVTGANGDGSIDPAGVWTIGTLAVGAVARLTATVTATTAGQYTGTASLASVDERDVDASNDLTSLTLTVQPQANLSITKTVSPAEAQIGDVLTYTVTVSNAGPSPATDVEAIDPMRLSARIIGVTTSQGTFDRAGRVWSVGTLADGASATLTVIVAVTYVARAVNEVRITQSGALDPDPSDNAAQAVAWIPGADLATSVTVTRSGPAAVDAVVTVSNTGPDAASGVTVTVRMPTGPGPAGADPSVGSYSDGRWTVGALTPGAAPVLRLRLRAGAKPWTLSARAAAVYPLDPDHKNDTASAAVPAATPGPRPGLAATGRAVGGLALLGALFLLVGGMITTLTRKSPPR
ncbi:DUF7507 domain-containing protein [Cryptosporangium phraense]|uniref:DUF11 domain-containing protein n=1 Tax=Cryptosporangium phraense TaxID=2593070 RepID=A0A545AMY0_9ACTN|nr:DUF11 domain-containing protein [Cryptosporangium phraense]TQS42646.1 DUF11 domain-containing protein [Cryptosporangium phraense]